MPASSSQRADRLVGRDEELATLREWLGRGERLVTIVGPPGVGKTRLAAELLRQLESARSSERFWTCFCDLSELTDRRGLAVAVSNELGIEPDRAKRRSSPDAALVRALSSRGKGVLVLDNVEQLAAFTADDVTAWLSGAPELVVVSTSRERLRAAGEVCLDLGPLRLPSDDESAPGSDAVTLFVERARLHDPEFSVDAGNAQAVRALVSHLDGLPLAIELAAARVGVMSVDELRRRTSSDIDVLSRGVRSTSSRQSSLRGAIQWSWDLLSAVEQDVLSRCSVFRGGFGLRAAEAVLDDPTRNVEVVDVLHALRDKSLVRVKKDTGEPRFDVCFGVREFAFERLIRAGHEKETRSRHASTYLGLAASARSELERSGRSDDAHALARDRDNLTSAYEYLASEPGAEAARVLAAIVALEPIFLSRGPVERLLELVEDYMARPDARSASASMVSRGLQARARALQLSASLDAAEQDFDAALALLRDDADRWQKASLLVDAGVLHHQRRHLDQARDCYTEALDLYESGGSPRQQARVLGNVGALHHDQRQFEMAETYYRRALHLLHRAEEPRLEGNILANLGLLSSESGRFDEADACLRRAEAVLVTSSDRRLLGIVRGNRGALALEKGELLKARELLGLAIRDLAEFGDSSSQALCLARNAAVEAALSDGSEWWTHSFAVERLIDANEDPLTLAAVRLYVALAELASVTPPTTDTLQRVHARIAAVRKRRADSGSSLAELSDDVRAALRLLERRLARIEPLSETLREFPEDTLVIGPDSAWFRPPGGVSQSLGAHGPVRRILLALSARAADAEPRGLSLDELREIGWPGEKIRPEAAANRVHVALAELRRRGLKAFIVRLPKGYALSDRVPIRRSDAPYPDCP